MITALSIIAATPNTGIGLSVPELCQFVAENISESDPSRQTRFAYQTRFYRAAEVDASRDDDATTQTKMQTWWNLYQNQLEVPGRELVVGCGVGHYKVITLFWFLG